MVGVRGYFYRAIAFIVSLAGILNIIHLYRTWNAGDVPRNGIDKSLQKHSIELLNQTISILRREIQRNDNIISAEDMSKSQVGLEMYDNHDPSVSVHADTTTHPMAIVNSSSGVGEFKQNTGISDLSRKPPQRKFIIFTMDSISSYEKNSKSGGAAGELTVRHALEYALDTLGAQVRTVRSDQEFASCNMKDYDTIILDPWTWAAKGWVPKRNLIGHEGKVYMLDFFGSKSLRGKGLNVPPSRFLTAFGATGNTFLGYFMTNDTLAAFRSLKGSRTKKQQGVIWGKDAKHFHGKERLLRDIANKVQLLSTATRRVFQHDNVKWLGHQTPASWLKLLSESKFLIGLGNPILGPSAIDAISVGCVFINPLFDKPVLDGRVRSQHPFAAKLGFPYVCNYREHDSQELQNCVDKALQSDLEGYLPPEFQLENYLQRVKDIFNL